MGRARQRRNAARGARPARAAVPVHPLQTFTRRRGPEQLDGAWAAVTAETDEARQTRPVARTNARAASRSSSPTRDRALYHAGAAIASNYLVTLHRAAASLFEAAGAPPEALVPLMRRTIENGFELTGPIERGDWATVERAPRRDPRRAARARAACTRALAEATARREDRCARSQTFAPRSDRRSERRPRPDDGRLPRRAPLAASRPPARRATPSSPSLFVNPAQFGDAADLDALPARRGARRARSPSERGRRRRSSPRGRGDLPARLPDLGRGRRELGAMLEGEHRPGPLPRRSRRSA